MVRNRDRNWYGVRTLIRVVATGRPKYRDEHFDSQSTLVEDRVVLFLAASFDEAIKQGERESRQYCRVTEYLNIYGQRVRFRYLKVADAFLIDGEPVAGCEVHSSVAIVPNFVSDSRLVNERFGTLLPRGAPSRYKFLDGEVLGQVLNRSGTKGS